MERGSSHLERRRGFSKENGEGSFLRAWRGPSPSLEEGLGWICTARWEVEPLQQGRSNCVDLQVLQREFGEK